MPICRPCRRTANAFGFFGSNFVTAALLDIRFLVVHGVEGAFLSLARWMVLAVFADEGLYGRDERTRDHNKVVVEDADVVQKGVEAWHDFAGLDAGHMHLRQAEAPSEFSLAPTERGSRFLQLLAHVLWQTFQTQWFDMLSYIFSHQ